MHVVTKLFAVALPRLQGGKRAGLGSQLAKVLPSSSKLVWEHHVFMCFNIAKITWNFVAESWGFHLICMSTRALCQSKQKGFWVELVLSLKKEVSYLELSTVPKSTQVKS